MQQQLTMNEPHVLGITVKKEENFSKWYTETCEKAELLEYTDISGCYVIKPWSFFVWQKIQEFFDKLIQEDGVQNCYFPCFVSKTALFKEANHIEGFSPEVAWVTKAGQSELSEHIAIRPTSETIMYPIFAKWVRSYRDLPLRINQWCNVVRWEFKHPVPFLRSREFLWQEGHTVYANLEDAEKEVMVILNFYKKVYEELLAVPVILGKKTEAEKFPGGFYTTTCEAFIPSSGRAIQAATSHCLGQNFSKMFEINFLDDNMESKIAWQNCWGLSTRSLGITFMTHGDDKGLVLPPKVSPIQVVIVPIFKGKNKEVVLEYSRTIYDLLKGGNIRVKLDDEDIHTPGWKFNNWDLKGVPIRFDIGQKEVNQNRVSIKRRDNGETLSFEKNEYLLENIKSLLDVIHDSLFQKSLNRRNEHLSKTDDKDQFIRLLSQRKMVLIPFCEKPNCEESICHFTQNNTVIGESDQQFELTGKAKSLCIPFEQDELPSGSKCIMCEDLAKSWTLFGRSY